MSERVEVDESHAAASAWRGRRDLLSRVLRSPLTYRELMDRPRAALSGARLRRLVDFVARAERTREHLATFIRRREIDARRSLFYTYWSDHRTLALGLLKRHRPDICIVSRAHGHDLYEERHDPPYLPCRGALLRGLERLFLVSDHGRDYLARRHPWLAPRCEVSRLGVLDPGFLTRGSDDGVFRIVSCAYVVPVKRVDLSLRAVQRLAESRPAQRLEWHHIGDGPLRGEVEAAAAARSGSNLTVRFLGRVPNRDVWAFYRRNPVDVFLNTSESEGLPVSIMEALSCGMPVAAPAVGGVPEVVSRENGVLLGPSPSPEEIAAALGALLDDPRGAGARRRASRALWERRYNASVNLRDFAERLAAISQRVHR